jgi:hypothetical protein
VPVVVLDAIGKRRNAVADPDGQRNDVTALSVVSVRFDSFAAIS